MNNKEKTLVEFNKLFDIDNDNLKTILSHMKTESIFFKNEQRLLSIEELLNYKEELNINIDHIIPLIDLYDNNFLIYNIKNDKFQILDISDDFIYDVDSIQKYMDNFK